MHKISALVLLLGFFSVAIGQEITVVDKTTQQPIPGVEVSWKRGIAEIKSLTDSEGKVSLVNYNEKSAITFRYKSYKKLTIDTQVFKGTKVEMEEDLTSLDEVIITVNRWEQDKIKVPNRINKIESKEIAFQNPQTAADVLENTGYAFIQKSQLAGGSPQLRGFGTNRILLVVDGVRMNNAIFRSGNLQNVISLDANTLENAEILFGPGAVMYGSDAMGGVMDFRTSNYQFSTTSKPLVNGSIIGRYSTANQEQTKSFKFNYGLQKWAFLSAASFSEYGDLRAGTHGNSYFLRPTYQQTLFEKDTTLINSDPSLQRNSGYSQFNLIQKIAFKPNENWLFDYSINYSETSKAGRYDRLIVPGNNGNLNFAEWYYGPQLFLMNRLGIVYSKKNRAFDQMRITAAIQNYSESRHDRRFNNVNLRNQYERVDAYSINLDFDKKFSARWSLFYGVETILNNVSSEANRINTKTLAETPTNTRYPDGSTWQSYGIYANTRFHINTKWTLHGGVRYSHFLIAATFDTAQFALPFNQAENSNGALNGSLGLVFNPNLTTQVYVNASTGFRAPNIDDIGKVFESGNGLVVVPNIDLRPEYVYSGEIGFVKSIANKLKIDGAIYYSYLQNALARRNFSYNGQDSILFDGQMSRVQAVQNSANGYVYGVQAGVNWSIWKGLSLRSTISYQVGEEQSADSLIFYPKSHVAPIFGRTSISYQIRKLRFDVYANYNGGVSYANMPLTERQDPLVYAKDSDGLPFSPSWMTLNAKMGFFPSKYVSIFIGIENITDQLYRTFGSGISAPGRNFIFTLRGTF